jgi:hypothetical protein
VDANDKSLRMVPPYPGPAPPDSDAGSDTGSDDVQEAKSEDNPPAPAAASPSSSQPSSPKRTQSSSARKAQLNLGLNTSKMATPTGPVEVQVRPTVHVVSSVRFRSASQKYKYTSNQASGRLPDFVAWQDLREDVKLAIRSGVEYSDAVDIMRQGAPVHQYFLRDHLHEFLVRMMFHHTLDDTFWTRYVPVSEFWMAEELLAKRLKRGMHPATWPDLRPAKKDLDDARETAEIVDIVMGKDVESSDESDMSEYSDKIEPTSSNKSKCAPSQSSSSGSQASSSGSDSEPQPPKSKTKRARSSSGSSSESDGSTTKRLTFTPTPKRPRPSR